MNDDENVKTVACCPLSGCEKTGVQCVEVSAPISLTPSATFGRITTVCQGSPVITCVTDAAGTTCTVTLTQKVCLSIPVQYGVNLKPASPTISCGGTAE